MTRIKAVFVLFLLGGVSAFSPVAMAGRIQPQADPDIQEESQYDGEDYDADEKQEFLNDMIDSVLHKEDDDQQTVPRQETVVVSANGRALYQAHSACITFSGGQPVVRLSDVVNTGTRPAMAVLPVPDSGITRVAYR